MNRITVTSIRYKKVKFRSMKIHIVSISIFLFLITACTDKDFVPDVSQITVEVDVVPIYKELSAIDSLQKEEELQKLVNKYPEFMTAYSYKIAKVGSPNKELYAQRMWDFITYDANVDIIDTAAILFPDFDFFKTDLTKGFQFYKYYYPKATIPQIYLMVSGFTQSIAVDSTWVGVSIEKYLGSNCIFYEWLQIPKYLRKGMTKEKMVPDVFRALAMTQYPESSANDDVVNSMIYNGKVKYFVKKMCPEVQDSLLFDYSKDQLKWAKRNEEDAWAAIVEWKHLFSDDRMTIQKYTGDAPYTAYFNNESAPRMGEYLGYEIVRAYMKNNPEVSLDALMRNNDGRKILAASKYRP